MRRSRLRWWRRRSVRLYGLLSLVLCSLLLAGAGQAVRGKTDALVLVQRLLSEWRVEEAAAQLATVVGQNKSDPEVDLVRAQLLFHQGDYDGAAKLLRAAVLALHLPPAEAADVRGLAELAASTADVTRGFAEQRSAGGHFLIRYRRGRDEVLVPYAAEALEKAWAALGEDFADIAEPSLAQPVGPVRVEIYEDIVDLSRVSTLTIKEIETSGTIALCKWNRLMIVSPRALVRGYPWIDTLTHEYTHYIVSRVSRNTVPIWLHEGLAKFQERRWRAPSGGGLTPQMENLLSNALSKGRLITFAQMSPSMAKLPSQEDTALAFAEVYTAVEFLHGKLGWPGLRRIVRELSLGRSDEQAIAVAYGGSFAQFERSWKGWLRGRKLRSKGSLFSSRLHFRKGRPPASKAPGDRQKDVHAVEEEDSGEIQDPKARGLIRVAGLLRARGRYSAAAIEYEKAQALLGGSHPLVALKLGRTYLTLDEPDRAIDALEPARELYAELPGINAALGSAWLKKGDARRAIPLLEAAIATNPFDPSTHCGLLRAYEQLGQATPQRERAAWACRLLGGKG
ncbi:MAG: tetratricopeptide repeat protein [Myxococcales bacterium]|nr:tetratricopeptide repeat protein [Myxococcales bacterium]